MGLLALPVIEVSLYIPSRLFGVFFRRNSDRSLLSIFESNRSLHFCIEPNIASSQTLFSADFRIETIDAEEIKRIDAHQIQAVAPNEGPVKPDDDDPDDQDLGILHKSTFICKTTGLVEGPISGKVASKSRRQRNSYSSVAAQLPPQPHYDT